MARAADASAPTPASSLTPLEISSGIVVGPDRSAPRGARCPRPLRERSTVPARPTTPLAALLEAVRPAVSRGPCLVSFSGGYDSTLVLAAATRVAREEGYADPVPITWRAAEAPKAEESAWQEGVVSELDLDDWIRLETGDDLDFVGPVARAVLGRYGLLYPANTHLHAPLIERAGGGSLLTGIGGDQVFGLWRWRAPADALAGRAPRTPRAAAQVVRSRLPAPLRQSLERRRHDVEPLPWLQAPCVAALHRLRMDERAAEPPTWAARVPWQAQRRRVTLGLGALAAIGRDHEVTVGHPLLDPGFVCAVAAAGGRDGFGRRAEAFEQLFGDLQTQALAGRRTKATFGEVFWRGHATQAAAAWSGGSVDPSIVDADALGALWRAPAPPLLTGLLLQHVTITAPRD